MTWIFSEDAALKYKLQGMYAHDVNAPPGGRPVQVRFRLPENEVTELSYPVIIIEHMGILPGSEREHRGYVQLSYAPEGYAPWWAPDATSYDPSLSPYYSYYPVPYNFDYQVTLYSRLSHFHLVPLVQQIASESRLPYHFGYVDVPQDRSHRTMILLDGPEFGYGKDQDGKRRYWVTWKVRVFSELVPQVTALFTDVFPVSQVNIDLSVYENLEDLSYLELSESFGILSVGSPPFTWNVDIPPTLPDQEPFFQPEHIKQRATPKVPHRTQRHSF